MTFPAKAIHRRKWLLQYAIICAAAALSVLVINSLTSRPLTLSEMLVDYLIGLDYSICIGGLLAISFSRAWVRTCSWSIFWKWLVRGAIVLLGTAIGCLMAGLPVQLFIGPKYNYWLSFRSSFSLALLLSVVCTAFITAYEIFKNKLQVTQLQLKEKEVERQKAEKLATEATLSSLESRLRPHFLFNTLNSIASLIREDPARAEKMLSQMADLLRFSLDSARSRLVPLAREVEIVRNYLEIEKARFESRLRYSINISTDLAEIPFPPLSIQTLVENSVKYAVGATRSGADIRINGTLQGTDLVITVQDNGPGFWACLNYLLGMV